MHYFRLLVLFLSCIQFNLHALNDYDADLCEDDDYYDDYYDETGFNWKGYDENGFDEEGFNAQGFDANGFDQFGWDRYGFDKNGFDIAGFNAHGFDIDGFDYAGFNRQGMDRDGLYRGESDSATNNLSDTDFDEPKHPDCYDAAGFDAYGFDQFGFDTNGFNKYGLDADGYDQGGYDCNGFDKEGFDRNGFNCRGFDIYGFDHEGYDHNGFDKDGFDREGLDWQGYDRAGFDSQGFDSCGYDRQGFHHDGYDVAGFNRRGLDIHGYNRLGFDAYGYDKEGFDSEGFSKQGLCKDDLSFNQKADGAQRAHFRKKYKKWPHAHMSIHKLNKIALEPEGSRYNDKMARRLNDMMKQKNKKSSMKYTNVVPVGRLNQKIDVPMEKGWQPQSPEVLDGRWRYNRTMRANTVHKTPPKPTPRRPKNSVPAAKILGQPRTSCAFLEQAHANLPQTRAQQTYPANRAPKPATFFGQDFSPTSSTWSY